MGKGGCFCQRGWPGVPRHAGPCRGQRSSLYNGQEHRLSRPHLDLQGLKAGRRLSCCFLKLGGWLDFEVVPSAGIGGGVHCVLGLC